MLIYIKCPSCSRFTSVNRALYQKKEDDIRNNPDLTEQEKSEKYSKLIKSMDLIPCCVIRVMGKINAHQIIKT
jgi:hypothetical protein